MESKSVWQIIFDTLNEAGFEVFSPGQHKGECIKPYIVLSQDGTAAIPGLSSRYRYFRILLYVPQQRYSFLDKFERDVENVIQKKLYPMVKPTGQVESDYFDDNYNAHMRAILYRNVYRDKIVK